MSDATTQVETRYLSDGTAKRGREIYETQLRDKLEPEHLGKYLVIDIDTGNYVMDTDELKATLHAMEQMPDARRFGMRIGYRASGFFGGRRIGREE